MSFSPKSHTSTDPNAPVRTPTTGEVVFDRVVYTGIGFGVNEIASLVFTDEFEHRSGKKKFEQIRDWLANVGKFKQKITADGIISPQQSAGNLLMTASLLVVGTLLVWPMKALTDSKAYWVKKANHLIDKFKGTELTEEQIAARDKEVDQALACEPKQSWPSLLAGRAVAMASTLTMSQMILKPQGMKKVGNFSENLLTKGKFSLQPATEPGAERTIGKRYAYLAGIETLCCIVSSVVLEVSSKFFASKGKQVQNPEKCEQAQDEASAKPQGGTNDSIVLQTEAPATQRYLRANRGETVKREPMNWDQRAQSYLASKDAKMEGPGG